MKLTDQQTGSIRLLLRSPDRGEGWRTVSAVLWPHITKWMPAELYEAESSPEGGGRIRLNDKGQLVAYWLC